MTSRVAIGIDTEITVDRVREVVGAYLGIDPAAIEASTPLSACGLDSLGALELVARLEDACGRRLPEWLLTECPDIGSVMAELAGGQHGADRLRGQLLADARLPADIRPNRTLQRPSTPRTILLTGATGFLGAWLLRTLVDETAADVVCLVRPSPANRVHDPRGRKACRALRDRVRLNLERYGLWSATVAARLRVVPGNLERPALGLLPPEHAALAREVDAIFHAGADVNWVSSYPHLRDANVGGTVDLLRLACAGRPKPLTFVSSLSVCYAVGGPPIVDERTAMLSHAHALPLGYAQSKCVAEALVREAGARGLPTLIVRPALITGDAATGLASTGDLMASLLKGCIEMGAAPDLDWLFDAVPVNVAARAIVRAGSDPATFGRTLHLAHPRPRHWRECVLWTNLFGYDVRLEAYERWLERLMRDAAVSSHTLHTLRPFFSRRLAGRTIPQHLEQSSRSRIAATESRAIEASLGITYPALGADLLDRYFRGYVVRGHLAPPRRIESPVWDQAPAAAGGHAPRSPSVGPSHWPSAAFVDAVLDRSADPPAGRVTTLEIVTSGSDHSIIGELTSWKSRHATGLFHCRLGLSAPAGARSLDVVVKVKPSDEDVLDVAATLAAVCDARVAEALATVRHEIGIRCGPQREVALYADANSHLRPWMPRCLAAWQDEHRRSWGVVLERLEDVEVIDASDSLAVWTQERVEATVNGLAAMHATHLGCDAELLAKPWIGHVRTSANVRRLVPFWRALASHAHERGRAWSAAALVVRHRDLLDTVDDWWPALDALPRTLIHHDFNPRNLALRRDSHGTLRLVAYDWELATLGAPQRDLVELLAFVLPPDVQRDTLLALIERHRVALEAASHRTLDRELWLRGCAGALADLLVSRLAFYALVDRVRPQRFLARVLGTWRRMDGLLLGELR